MARGAETREGPSSWNGLDGSAGAVDGSWVTSFLDHEYFSCTATNDVNQPWQVIKNTLISRNSLTMEQHSSRSKVPFGLNIFA